MSKLLAAHVDSPPSAAGMIYTLHPLVKLLLLVVFSLDVFLLREVLPGILLFSILLLCSWLGGIGLTHYIHKLRAILVFSAFIIFIQILFCKEGKLLLDLPLLSVWSAGVLNGLVMAFRFLNVIGASYLFVESTDANRFAYSLMQAGLPYREGFMLVTALRFIPVFRLELARIRSAQLAKGIDVEKMSLRNIPTMLRYLFIPLIVSALGKVDSLTISMEGRAFGRYYRRTYRVKQATTTYDWMALFGGLSLLVGIYLTYS